MSITKKNYFDGRKCYVCKSKDTYVKNSGSPLWHRHIDKGDWTGEYLCDKCFKKSDRLCRNKSLSRDSSVGKGFIGEQIFCKTRGLKNCNVERDNFNSKEDTIDPEYGIVQIKLRRPYYGEWRIFIGNEHNFDHLVVICMNYNMDNIERIYIIPKEELHGMTSMNIRKNVLRGICMWEKFRVNHMIYNSTYHNMKLKDCPILDDNIK